MNRKRTSVVLSAIAAMVLMLAVLAGCSGGGNVSNTSSADNAGQKTDGNETQVEANNELPPVKLIWIQRNENKADRELVQAEVNKIVKQKINAEVELKFIEPGAYEDKMRTTIASGEYYDIAFTASNINDFYGNSAKGAFLPITDLVKQYAPLTYKSMPEMFWDAVTLKGDIYGVPNYQIVARQNGIIVQQAMLDKYDFNLNNVSKLEQLEPLLEQMKENEPQNKIVFFNHKVGIWNDLMVYYGFDPIGTPNSPGVVRIGDSGAKVINQYDSEEFVEHVQLMRNWLQKGYIQKNAVTLTDIPTVRSTGNVLSGWNNFKPGDAAELANLFKAEVAGKTMDVPFVTTGNISATLQAVSSNSKHPERALMLIELMNTDKELYNLVTFGIEGKHYTKTGDNRIELIPDSGYSNRGWAVGNQFNAYLLPSQEDDVWEQTIQLNESAKVSNLLGFVFDAESVKNELAQIQSVIDEFAPALWTGAVEPDQYMPQFLDKLEVAGASKVIAEKQSQLDAWLQSK